MNQLNSSQDQFHIGMQSCQGALQQISQGENPYDGWFKLSDSQGWANYSTEASSGQDVDVTAVQSKVAKDPGQYGVPWVHQGANSGGTDGDQVPIKMIYDVVVAGYNVLVDPSRALDDQDAAPGTSELAYYWKTPDEAGKWAQLLLGDIYVSADKAKQETQGGRNLESILTDCPDHAQNNLTCVKTLQSTLAGIVQSTGTPSASTLATVSSHDTLITTQVIDGIRNNGPQEQALSISKLANDVAVQNLFDELRMLRNVLEAGAHTKPVYSYKDALNATHHAIANLTQMMDNLTKSYQMQAQMMTRTAQIILGTETANQADALSTTDHTQAQPMQGGAVYQQEGN